MQSIPILTMETVERMMNALEDFVNKSEAMFALVIDRGGAVFCQHGSIPDSTDTAVVAALAAGSYAATRELAARVGEAEFSALHQQGERFQVLMSSIDDDAVLVTVFGPTTTLGLVRFYSARTVKRLAAVLEEARSSPQVRSCLPSQEDVNQTVFNR